MIMQFKKKTVPVVGLLIVLSLILMALSFFMTGCMPGGGGPGGKPARKKMLTADLSVGGWEGLGLAPGSGESRQALNAPALPFYLMDTTMLIGGEETNVALLRSPSADYDYLLLFAKGYEAWLPAWLAAWPQSGRQGFVIDLTTGDASQRADLQVKCPGLQEAIPLVLMWNPESADRARVIQQFLSGLTAVHCEQLHFSGQSK
jgi:hypothetical protein